MLWWQFKLPPTPHSHTQNQILVAQLFVYIAHKWQLIEAMFVKWWLMIGSLSFCLGSCLPHREIFEDGSSRGKEGYKGVHKSSFSPPLQMTIEMHHLRNLSLNCHFRGSMGDKSQFILTLLIQRHVLTVETKIPPPRCSFAKERSLDDAQLDVWWSFWQRNEWYEWHSEEVCLPFEEQEKLCLSAWSQWSHCNHLHRISATSETIRIRT